MNEDGSRSLIIPEEYDSFMSMIDHLISDEERHVELVNSYVGNIERIR